MLPRKLFTISPLLLIAVVYSITNVDAQDKKSENVNANDKRVMEFVGEFVLIRDYEALIEVLPNKTEYERIRIHLENNEIKVVYNGVEIVGDHGYVGLFVVEAMDVVIDKNKISFKIVERSLYPPDNAPQDLEDEREQRKVDTTRGFNTSRISLNGKLTDTGIKFQCESPDCYSDVMIFNRN